MGITQANEISVEHLAEKVQELQSKIEQLESKVVFAVRTSWSSQDFVTIITKMQFDQVDVNVGGAWSTDDNSFTAPRTGNYQFSFGGALRSTYSKIALLHNGEKVSEAYTPYEEEGTFETFTSRTTIIPLKKGDKVWYGYKGAQIAKYAHFSGMEVR